MAVKFEKRRFSKPGKGYAQVAQTDIDGKPILDSDGNPVIGNEQYDVDQLTDDSIDSSDVKTLVSDILESVNGDLVKAASMFREGWNRNTRLAVVQLDEYQKAARGIAKLAADSNYREFAWVKGLDVNQVAERLRKMNG